MTMLRIAKKDGVFCYTIRSQNTYCKEHTRGYFLRDGYLVVIYLDENNMDLDISSIIDVRELKSCEGGIENYRDYPDFFYFFNWGYRIVGHVSPIITRCSKYMHLYLRHTTASRSCRAMSSWTL